MKIGSVDKSVVFRIITQSSGAPVTDVTAATAGLEIGYWRNPGGLATTISLIALSALSDAHSDGGFLHIGGGYYRLDAPDACWASGAEECLFYGTLASRILQGGYFLLVAFDAHDSNGLGLTRLDVAISSRGGPKVH